MLLKKNAMNKNKSFSRVNLVHLYSNIKELISLKKVYVGNASIVTTKVTRMSPFKVKTLVSYFLKMVSLIEISVSQNYFFEK